jgi:hypothetical protein
MSLGDEAGQLERFSETDQADLTRGGLSDLSPRDLG